MCQTSEIIKRVQGARKEDRFASLHAFLRGAFPTKFEKGRDNMNIYYDYEGIIGKPQQAHLRNTLGEIFELARGHPQPARQAGISAGQVSARPADRY